MKPVLQAVLFLGLVAPSFSAMPSVDFDGKSAAKHDMNSFLKELSPEVSVSPTKPIEEYELVRKPGIVEENGVFTPLEPINRWRGEDGIVRTEYKYWPSQKISWSLECKGTSQPTWNAKQTYTFTSDQDAGHLHYDPPMPSLKVSKVYDSNVSAPADGEFYPRPSPFYLPSMSTNMKRYYWEFMPVFATTLVEEFQSFGACTGTQIDIIRVQVPGLSEMLSDPNYVLYKTENTIQNHPKCHNGRATLKTALKTIADKYKAEFPTAGVVQIFHMSLPWGGKFDLNNGWGVDPAESHQGHQYGIEADIRKVTVPLANRRRLLEIMCANTVKVYSEIPAHYHLRVAFGKESEFPESLFAYEKSMVTCCENGVINEDNMAACIN
ncbi:MAG: hypothetical protein M0Q43_10435 [Methanothrix sp.]|jgi:hypothetical protein|nr:hypothetical protein [Methanothrix sp.]